MSNLTEETAQRLAEALDSLAGEVFQLKESLNNGIDLEASVRDTLQSLINQLKELNSKK
jgi:hypothetical protein